MRKNCLMKIKASNKQGLIFEQCKGDNCSGECLIFQLLLPFVTKESKTFLFFGMIFSLLLVLTASVVISQSENEISAFSADI